MQTREAPVSAFHASAYRIPTDAPEADGTFSWDATTLIIVELAAGNQTGVGYTYADACVAPLVRDLFAATIADADCFDIPRRHAAMQRFVRNLGRSGLAACAISALDAALWDLKSRLLGVALASLLGRRRETAPIYGSGGFTTYDDARLAAQLEHWSQADGCKAVKMKIGSEPGRDPQRVAVARRAIGDCALFVDANGAFSASEALRFAETTRDLDVAWFEEPVTSDDLSGLRLVRRAAPAGMDVAAGEYNYTLDDARRLLEAEAVDVLQADVTRCGGVTGFLAIAALCEAHHIDLSGHCAPSLHRHVACAAPRLRHLEWFHDHVRIERMLFDGAPTPCDGAIRPDLGRPGHGFDFKWKDAERFKIGELG